MPIERLYHQPDMGDDPARAYDFAMAASPGETFLAKNPDLPRNARDSVKEQIGAAMLLVDLFGPDMQYPYTFPDVPELEVLGLESPSEPEVGPEAKPESLSEPEGSSEPEIEPESEPEPIAPYEKALIEQWVKAHPDWKRINGRPVVKQDHMLVFDSNRAQPNPKLVTQIWNALKDAPRIIAQDPNDIVARVQNFSPAESIGAGNDANEYTDLYGLFVIAQAVEAARAKEAVSRSKGLSLTGLRSFGRVCEDFVTAFVKSYTRGIGFEPKQD